MVNRVQVKTVPTLTLHTNMIKLSSNYLRMP
jgi:hypothetical protein